MKANINLDVDKELLTIAEQYAERHRLSLTQLIESFFKRLAAAPSSKNVVQLVRELKKPTIDENKDLVQVYYEEQGDKHGF